MWQSQPHRDKLSQEKIDATNGRQFTDYATNSNHDNCDKS